MGTVLLILAATLMFIAIADMNVGNESQAIIDDEKFLEELQELQLQRNGIRVNDHTQHQGSLVKEARRRYEQNSHSAINNNLMGLISFYEGDKGTAAVYFETACRLDNFTTLGFVHNFMATVDSSVAILVLSQIVNDRKKLSRSGAGFVQTHGPEDGVIFEALFSAYERAGDAPRAYNVLLDGIISVAYVYDLWNLYVDRHVDRFFGADGQTARSSSTKNNKGGDGTTGSAPKYTTTYTQELDIITYGLSMYPRCPGLLYLKALQAYVVEKDFTCARWFLRESMGHAAVISAFSSGATGITAAADITPSLSSAAATAEKDALFVPSGERIKLVHEFNYNALLSQLDNGPVASETDRDDFERHHQQQRCFQLTSQHSIQQYQEVYQSIRDVHRVHKQQQQQLEDGRSVLPVALASKDETNWHYLYDIGRHVKDHHIKNRSQLVPSSVTCIPAPIAVTTDEYSSRGGGISLSPSLDTSVPPFESVDTATTLSVDTEQLVDGASSVPPTGREKASSSVSTVAAAAAAAAAPTVVLPSLQIGCSSWDRCVRPGFLIADAVANVTTHFVTLAYSLPMIATGSIGLVYSSHTLEHLSYNLPPRTTCAHYPQSDETVPGCANEVDTALQEWRRVLVAGGQLLVGVPDLQAIASFFIETKSHREKNIAQQILHGGQINQFDVHKTGFHFGYLKQLLDRHGFCNVTQVDEFGLFRDASRTTFYFGKSISLNVQATAC
mmetsp:Transcript_5852/g.9656  ORF Transcript_5852/g.9656 Transcript_5852/m.9656 type:complete len:728 (+) Transcript_5852:54-2237(+)